MIDKLPVWECATQTFQLPHLMLAKQFINNSGYRNTNLNPEPSCYGLTCANHFATAAACASISKIQKTDGLFPRTSTSPPLSVYFPKPGCTAKQKYNTFTWPLTLRDPIMSPLGEYTFVTVGGQVDTYVLIPAKNTNRSFSV